MSTPGPASRRKIAIEALSHTFEPDGRTVPVLADVTLDVAETGTELFEDSRAALDDVARARRGEPPAGLVAPE